jgi:hypothetical protein
MASKNATTAQPATRPLSHVISVYRNITSAKGHGASRHFLPAKPEKEEEMGESYITWLYPMGAIIFSDNLLLLRGSMRGVLWI